MLSATTTSTKQQQGGLYLTRAAILFLGDVERQFTRVCLYLGAPRKILRMAHHVGPLTQTHPRELDRRG